MVLFKTIVILVIISTNVQAADCKTHGKIETVPAIIDGELVKKSEWPWMVSIMVQYKSQTFNCGGSLIHRSWVLTAAHCLYSSGFLYMYKNPVSCSSCVCENYKNKNHKAKGFKKLEFGSRKKYLRMASCMLHAEEGNLLPKEAFRILIGAIDIENGRNEGFETKISYYVKNPGFIMKAVKKKNNDIALLKLIRPVPKKYDHTIKIGQMSTPQDGDRCIAMGWGCDHNSATPMTTSRLFHVVLPVIPIDKCAGKFQELINGDVKTKICAGFFNRTTGICSGDSGGPLICRQNQRWVLSGIISFTIEMSPAVFTRVASYNNWVMDVIKKEEAHTRSTEEKKQHLLTDFFQNPIAGMPTHLNGYPLYNYVLYRKLIPYVNLNNVYGRYIFQI